MEQYINKIIHDDCMNILKQLPDKCIDLVLTDPPYGINCDGGGYGLGIKPKELDKKDWDSDKPTKDVFNEIFRISKNQLIFGGNYFTEYLRPTKAWIFWDKIGSYKLKNNFSEGELIWTSFKGVTKKYTFVQQGFVNGDKEENKFRFHPTQKPLKLFEMILRDYSNENDLILDCFSGSGTLAVACHNLKRRFICIEKDYDYWKASVERLENAQAQLKLF